MLAVGYAMPANCDTPQTFDQLANSYDDSFSHTLLGQYYRQRVQRKMQQYWPADKQLLEINAGTGEDALYLASLGNRVLATDIAPNMVSVINHKAQHANLGDTLDSQTLAIEQLNQLKQQPFDGILSNFGGLNCVADIPAFVSNAHSLLKPNGILIMVLMGRWVPWEWGYFAYHRQWRKATRRLSGQAQWRQHQIYYPRLSQVKRHFAPHFELLQQQGLGITVPPSYVNDAMARNRGSYQVLTHIEHRLKRLPILAHIADHYLLIYRRKGQVL